MEIPMLTREYIMNLEAGREMDALVAEKVMGHTITEESNDKSIYIEEYEEGYGRCHRLYDVSENLLLAWKVVEQLNGKYSFTIQRLGDYFYQDPDYGWEAIFSGYANRKVKADTAQLAICRAALLTTIQGEDKT